ncbi:MAG: DUF2141 domain-containing protein [Spirochaetaceae bacterium]
MNRLRHEGSPRRVRRFTLCLAWVILLVGIHGTPAVAREGRGNSRSSMGDTDQELTVAGTISGITEDAPLLVSIVDRDGWDASDEELENPDALDGYVQGLRLDPDGAAEVRYEFTDVPPGTYAVRAFLDSNRNDDLDIGILGPKEPWAIYRAPRPVRTPPRFDRVSFDLTDSRHDLDMELR